MERNEYSEFTGNLIDNLVNKVEQSEAKFYRPARFAQTPRITTADTPSTVAGWAYENDGCEHCHAAFGHLITCPLINRAVAEAKSALLTPTEGDKIYAHALGIQL